jgi:hypothetical protein
VAEFRKHLGIAVLMFLGVSSSRLRLRLEARVLERHPLTH